LNADHCCGKVKKYIYIFVTFLFLGVAAMVLKLGFWSVTPGGGRATKEDRAMKTSDSPFEAGDVIPLPEPVTDGTVSLEKALGMRRSVRTYSGQPLLPRELGQLLWSAQGITSEQGYRTAPSAGASFPLEMFVLANRVEGLSKGLYHYRPLDHELAFIRRADIAQELARACLGQAAIANGAAVLVFSARFDRTTQIYGERGIRYVYNEVGHAAQNVHLQAAALNLGTVVVGAFHDDEVEDLLQLNENYRVIYLMPVGKI